MGPHFRASLERFGTAAQVKKIDAVVLTHNHMDAIVGLDTLREVQLVSERASERVRERVHERAREGGREGESKGGREVKKKKKSE